MNTKYILCVLLVLSFVSGISAQPLTESEIEKIDAYILDRIGENDAGIAYGVVRNGVVELEKYQGMANLQHMIPVSAKSKFNIASVAKQFTALMVLDLALQGELNLDDDFRDLMPEYYPDIKEPIRIRHILNHTSGIRDYPDLLSLVHKPWWRQVGFDNGDALELLQSQNHLNFSPGSAYVYSNSNYTILTKIIEIVSGTKFHEYAGAFLSQLGMEHSEFNKSYMQVISNVALPYSDWGDGVWQQYPHLTNLYGDGFLYTTLQDQLTFEVAVQHAGKEGNELLVHSQRSIEGSEITSYGFGLELGTRNGHPAVHHSGGTGSYHAQVVRYPEENLSIVVMSNNSRLWSGYVADHIFSVLLPNNNANTANPALDKSEYAEQIPAASLAGSYLSDKGFVVEIQQKSDTLQWQSANRNPFFMVQDAGSIYQFTYNPAEKVAFAKDHYVLFTPDAAPRRYTKLPDFTPDSTYKKHLAGRYYNEELDLTYTIALKENEALSLKSDARDRSYTAVVQERDYVQFSSYSFNIQRNDQQEVESLVLSHARLRNVQFKRVE